MGNICRNSHVFPARRGPVSTTAGKLRAAVRKGDWKLVWRAILPSQVELFNLAEDPSEKTNLADKNPQKVAELQQRIQALAREAVQPLILKEVFGVARHVLFGSVALPGEEKELEKQP